MSAKKIFIAAILMTFAIFQVAFAANFNIPVDWSKVKKISSKSDLAQYLEQSKRNGQTMIPVILTNGLKVDLEEFLQLCPSSLVSTTAKPVYNDGQNIRIIYEVIDYPGTKVANAYLSGDTSKLNQDELKLYNVAVKIVNEAKKLKGWANQEMYIYNEIARRTNYFTDTNMQNQPRFVTAIGALVDGKANCQGYSDAFYMLGRMMGWEVGRMSGTVGGGAHMWNTITFNAGKAAEKTYCVDVTFGDSVLVYGSPVNKIFNMYVYFNAPIEIMQVTHSWDFSAAPKQIVGSIDTAYSYCVYSNLGRANSAAAGIKLLAEKLTKSNVGFASVIVPYEEKYSTNPANSEYFRQEINSRGFNKRWWVSTRKHGKYIFLTACIY